MHQHGALTDAFFMHRAIELAYSALGSVSPNPAVGAVVVKDGTIIGEGATEKPGGKHAERIALSACDAKDATLYVTLEPCCHAGKRTPPCCPAIVEAGVRRVVVGVQDTNPRVNGKGMAELRNAGIAVDAGILGDEARECHAFFLKWVAQKVPFVTMKVAITRDGMLTWGDGRKKQISGDAATARVHELRAGHDAILVGVGTILKDDPELTVRKASGRDPVRVILDSRLRTPPNAHALEKGRTILFCTEQYDRERYDALSEKADIVIVGERNGRVDIAEALAVLGELGITSVLAETGTELAPALLPNADRLVMIVAPFTKPEGVSFFAALGKPPELFEATEEQLGEDLFVSGSTRKPE